MGTYLGEGQWREEPRSRQGTACARAQARRLELGAGRGSRHSMRPGQGLDRIGSGLQLVRNNSPRGILGEIETIIYVYVP